MPIPTHRSPPLSALPLLALAASVAACGGAQDAATGHPTVQDSAGVPVVVNSSESVWDEGEAWRLEEELRIGGSNGDSNVQFGQVVGIDLDDDGVIYVADMQARQVLVFEPDGSMVRTFGQAGSGPGELGGALQGPFVTGDTVRIVDLQNQRVSRYSAAGEPIGSFRLDFASGNIPMRWDENADGTLVTQFRSIPLRPDAPANASAGDPVVTLDDDGGVHDTLTVLPPGESFTMQGGEARMRMFESEPQWDVGADGTLLSGRNHVYRIDVRDADGGIRHVVTMPHERRPITERDKEIFLAAILDAFERQGLPSQAAEQMQAMMSFADYYPAFASLLVGPGGTLWAQQLRTGEDLAGEEGGFDPQGMGSDAWDVFDADGGYLGVVVFPERFQPLRVAGDRFWGVGRDDLDVQSVVAYRLVR